MHITNTQTHILQTPANNTHTYSQWRHTTMSDVVGGCAQHFMMHTERNRCTQWEKERVFAIGRTRLFANIFSTTTLYYYYLFVVHSIWMLQNGFRLDNQYHKWHIGSARCVADIHVRMCAADRKYVRVVRPCSHHINAFTHFSPIFLVQNCKNFCFAAQRVSSVCAASVWGENDLPGNSISNSSDNDS